MLSKIKVFGHTLDQVNKRPNTPSCTSHCCSKSVMTKFKQQESQYSFSKIHVLKNKQHYRISRSNQLLFQWSHLPRGCNSGSETAEKKRSELKLCTVTFNVNPWTVPRTGNKRPPHIEVHWLFR